MSSDASLLAAMKLRGLKEYTPLGCSKKVKPLWYRGNNPTCTQPAKWIDSEGHGYCLKHATQLEERKP